jgi:hypothetical protein
MKMFGDDNDPIVCFIVPIAKIRGPIFPAPRKLHDPQTVA